MMATGRYTLDGLGSLRLYLSCLGAGFVVLDGHLPDGLIGDVETDASREVLRAYEQSLTDRIGPLVAGWSRRVAEAAAGDVVRAQPESTLPAGQMLWWHHVAIGASFPAARWYGVPTELDGGAIARVGDGVTNLPART